MTKKNVKKSIKTVPLGPKFWNDFSKKYWEKKHLHVKNIQSSLQKMDESEVFKLLILYSNQCRKNKNPTGFKFFIQGQQTNESDILQILPVRKDKSLLGYHLRMQKMFSDYCLVCDELLSVNSEQMSVLTDFTDQLFKSVGFPNRFSEIGLYLGNYQKTPFGVHVDHCGVFSFPVVGEKKFRLWTADFVKKNPSLDRAFKYEKYKKYSQVLNAHPGDMTYWPSSAWHIAESEGSFSATWSLGVWVDRSHEQFFADGVTEILSRHVTDSDKLKTTAYKKLHLPTGEVKQLPDAFVKSIQNFKEITTEELTEAFTLLWLKHISRKGLKTFSQNQGFISLQSKIRLKNLKAPILWFLSPSAKSKVYLSFGGVTIESTTRQGLHSLILELNQGQTCKVKDFLCDVEASSQLKLLNQMAKAGAFTEFK